MLMLTIFLCSLQCLIPLFLLLFLLVFLPHLLIPLLLLSLINHLTLKIAPTFLPLLSHLQYSTIIISLDPPLNRDFFFLLRLLLDLVFESLYLRSLLQLTLSRLVSKTV